jgi:hypothetical protein
MVDTKIPNKGIFPEVAYLAEEKNSSMNIKI